MNLGLLLLCTVALLASALPGAVAATGNLLTNGGFEKDATGWNLDHDWYAKPQGGGLSETKVAAGEGRDGGKALRFAGNSRRAIAIQTLPVYPGQYRVSGWIRCEKLDAGQAGVLCEWMSRENAWMRGDPAVMVKGTQEWRRFEATMTAPPEARSLHFDLLTTEPNNGTVWFDDIELARIPSNLPLPEPPRVSVETAPGEEGSLTVQWAPKALPPGSVRLLVYCEERPLAQAPALAPIALLDPEAGTGRILSLENGKSYHVAVRLINADGQASPLGPEAVVRVSDRQPPRAGWLDAERSGALTRVSWSPHVLDPDVQRVCFCLRGAGEEPGAPLKSVDVAALYAEPRPFFCTLPWLTVELPVPADASRVGAWCEDRAGNRGPMVWTEIRPARPAGDLPQCALWFAPATESISRGAQPPAQAGPAPEPRLMRGEAKGFQLALRPGQDLHRVRVSFEAPLHEDGRTRLDPRWLASHFVSYVHLEKNSVATPKEELVWPGPAEYPDELSDDTSRDLRAAQTQPLYVRVTAPREALPGRYQGRGFVESDEGRREFRFAFRVERLALPDLVRLPFVYWFAWDEPCKQFGVEERSTDGWRVLSQIGHLMRAHHQRAVVVPWSLVHTWRAADGKWIHDFRDFDRFIRTFQAAGVDQLFMLAHIGGRATGDWECPTMSSHSHEVRDLATGEAVERLDAVDLLPALQTHLEALGLLDRFVVHVADEPIPANLESYRQLSARVRQAAPRLRRIDAVHVPNLQGSLEVWVPQINYFEQWLDQYRAAQKAGNEVWFYIAWVPQGKFPNRMIDGGAIKPRVTHWLNALYDTQGYLHWALNRWSIPLTSLNSPGDQYICWPSKRFVANSSLRYEAEREGLEDCELLFLLRDALMRKGLNRADAQKGMEAIGRKAVRDFQDYTRSWSELETVRAELLEKLGE